MLANLNQSIGVRKVYFPDSQPHIQLNPSIVDEGVVDLCCSICSPRDLFELMLFSNACDRHGVMKGQLRIPYLMGARFDRVMQHGDSFDLEVVASLINQCGFQKVLLLDPHSDVATALIKNSFAVSNTFMLSVIPDGAAIVLPDAGAAKKSKNYPVSSPLIQCVKHRDLSTGELTLKVLNPEFANGKDCFIVDDLCDGGATFIAIAKQMPGAKTINLVATHGIFSKGVKVLADHFDRIFTTNSYPFTPHPLVTLIEPVWTNI